MGLENNLTDVSSESIPIMLVSLIATCVAYLRTVLFTTLQYLGLSRLDPSAHQTQDGLFDTVGSSLAGLIVLAEQLNLNRSVSYKYKTEETVSDSECVVCLNRLVEGDTVRKLACRHVFHKECLDGWIDQFKFHCPLCRSTFFCEERLNFMRRRVSGDIIKWFSLR